MPPVAPLTNSDRLAVAAIAVAAILVAAPGVHLFERWMAHVPAVVVSHGIAVAGLAIAWREWRRRSRRAV